jgi:hypothetical protein
MALADHLTADTDRKVNAMRTFHYEGKDNRGHEVNGTLEAADIDFWKNVTGGGA